MAALQLLKDAGPGGCTESIMLAHGFKIELLARLVREGLARVGSEQRFGLCGVLSAAPELRRRRCASADTGLKSNGPSSGGAEPSGTRLDPAARSGEKPRK